MKRKKLKKIYFPVGNKNKITMHFRCNIGQTVPAISS